MGSSAAAEHRAACAGHQLHNQVVPLCLALPPGIVADEVKVGIENSRMGNYNMRLSGHILLLNWNSSSAALLRQIASAHAEGGMYNNGRLIFNNRPPVVVLADKKKVEMDAAVHETLRWGQRSARQHHAATGNEHCCHWLLAAYCVGQAVVWCEACVLDFCVLYPHPLPAVCSQAGSRVLVCRDRGLTLEVHTPARQPLQDVRPARRYRHHQRNRPAATVPG